MIISFMLILNWHKHVFKYVNCIVVNELVQVSKTIIKAINNFHLAIISMLLKNPSKFQFKLCEKSKIKIV